MHELLEIRGCQLRANIRLRAPFAATSGEAKHRREQADGRLIVWTIMTKSLFNIIIDQ
jgi:hypothetical protein